MAGEAVSVELQVQPVVPHLGAGHETPPVRGWCGRRREPAGARLDSVRPLPARRPGRAGGEEVDARGDDEDAVAGRAVLGLPFVAVEAA